MYETDADEADRELGCLLGLALGDALGAPYEGGPIERLLWRVIGRTRGGARRYTDDTQMALDLVGSVLACDGLDQDDLARRFAQSYRWSRGYGPGAARTLKRIRRGEPWSRANRAVYATGSLGNGGAMRAPVLALLFGQGDALVEAARASAQVTHAHPEGVEGAVLIAQATGAALEGASALSVLDAALSAVTLEAFGAPLRQARSWLKEGQGASARQVAQVLGTRITAAASCPAAIYMACAHFGRGFTELLGFARACGGDVDTVSAMAGAIWGARHGAAAIPEALRGQVEGHRDICTLAPEVRAWRVARAGA